MAHQETENTLRLGLILEFRGVFASLHVPHPAQPWFFRYAFQLGEGAFLDRTRYLSTVDFAKLMPSFPSSPTMRGVPHSGLVLEIVRINLRISALICGRPVFPALLRHAQ